MAASDFGVWPATYRRRLNSPASGDALGVDIFARSRGGVLVQGRIPRIAAIRERSASFSDSRDSSWPITTPASVSSASSCARSSSICRSTAARRRASSRRRRSVACCRDRQRFPFARLLRSARGAGQHAGGADIGVEQQDALVGELVLAQLLGMVHATRLQQADHAVALAVGLDILERDPGVHQRRYAAVVLAHLVAWRRQAGEKCGDPAALADVGQPHQGGVDLERRAAERRNRIDHQRLRLELLDVAIHPRQVHLEAEQAGPRRLEPQQAGIDVTLQIDPDRGHVAHDLVGRFLEREDTGSARHARRPR